MFSLTQAIQRYMLRLQMREVARRADATIAEIRGIPARRERASARIDADLKALEKQRDELFDRAAELREEEFWLGRSRTCTPAYTIEELRGPDSRLIATAAVTAER